MNKIQITELIKQHHPNVSGRQYEIYIELAADRIAEETGVTKKTFLINSVAGKRWYDLDTSIMEIDIVEKVTNAVTRDGRTSNFQSCSITGSSNIRVYATTFANKFTQAASGTDQEDAMLSTVGPLRDIPTQFHEILAMGAIAYGYKFPPNFDIQAHQVFMDDFLTGIKRIKKWHRTKTTTGFIKPQDF